MLELLKVFLERSGDIDVDTVGSPEDALARLAKGGHDAVVSDFLMPGMDGLQLLKRVRAEHGDMPFVLLTGRGREDVAIEALNSGADFYLPKGADPKTQFAELTQMIRATVEKRRSQLREHETSDLLGAVVRSSPGALVVVDPEGKVIMWNPAATQVFGWTEEEVLGKPPPIIPPGKEGEFRDIVARTLDGTMKSGTELKRLRKDGDLRDVIGNFARIMEKDGVPRGAVAVFTDVTRLKRMEEDLRRINKLYGFLSHTNATIVRAKDQKWLFDEACRVAVEHGRFTMASVSVLDPDGHLVHRSCSGIEMEQLEAMCVPNPDGRRPTRPMDIAVQEGRTVVSSDMETDFGTEPWFSALADRGVKSISALPLRESERIIGALTICSTEPCFLTKEERLLLEEVSADLSFALDGLRTEKAKRRAQSTLKRESEFTQAVLDTAGAIIIVLDSEGRIVRFNKEAEEVTGMTADEVHGRHIWETFVPEELRPRVREGFARMLAEGVVRDHEDTWVTKGGARRLVQWTDTVLRNGEGDIRYIIATGIDVTERRKDQEDLRRKTEEALMARNRAQTYLDFMTHDIMNIITPLASYSEMLLHGDADPAMVERYATKMMEQTTRLARFVTHVRKLAHSEIDARQGFEAADLRRVLGEREAELRDRYRFKRVIISYSMPEGPVMVRGKGYAADVLAEVLENAVKHSDSPEAVIEVTIRSEVDGAGTRTWRVDVADHGPGIPDEQKRTLLAESLVDDSSKTRGVATSFPFMTMIVEHMGGSLTIEDRVDGDHTKGARIVLRLPVASDLQGQQDAEGA